MEHTPHAANTEKEFRRILAESGIRDVTLARDNPNVSPKICWLMTQNLALLAMIQKVLSDFPGKLKWMLTGGASGTICIMPVHGILTFVSPIWNVGQSRAGQSDSPPHALESIQDCSSAHEEFESLLAFLVARLEKAIRKDPELPDEDSMYAVSLVRDPEKFLLELRLASEDERALDFGLSYAEWKALYLEVLLEGEVAPIPDDGMIGEFTEDIPGYPLLSRINGILNDSFFEAEEVPNLREECLRVRASTNNKAALHGLHKLICICDEAIELRLGIVFLAP